MKFPGHNGRSCGFLYTVGMIRPRLSRGQADPARHRRNASDHVLSRPAGSVSRNSPCRPLPIGIPAEIGFVFPMLLAGPICHNFLPTSYLPSVLPRGKLALFRRISPTSDRGGLANPSLAGRELASFRTKRPLVECEVGGGKSEVSATALPVLTRGTSGLRHSCPIGFVSRSSAVL